ncbi:Ger(x)C family spore germination protein [Cytobacillus purgationiresistens]|uniref:Ger(X)C family germination protein n=1 Tax=Cytobacillus purgationiresistens TaxID=863449 RepID=A0ABU0ACB5_9BACI|nr:Ger(x)C family spore germination protein [Cytobacillus purgationiresistens]MDQ0268356.1 Ger(x)C family germination protein [Cytobacillus purgationiresistens]
MKYLAAIICTIWLLSGCGEITEVQYQAYAVGIGIDYKDDLFHVYLQFMDFSNIAKVEGSTINAEKPIWLAVGHGNTIDEAFIDLYNGLQIKANFDQMNLFIFTRDAIDQKLGEIIQSFNTNFNFRLNGWVYGTEGNLEEILTAKMPFFYPYIASHIVQPYDTHRVSSDIPPLSTEQLLYKTKEETNTLIFPIVTIKDNIIHMDSDDFPVTTLNGAFFNKGYKLLGSLSKEQIFGFIRINSRSERTLLHVYFEDIKSPVSIELRDPKVKRKVKEKDGEDRYQLNIKVSVNLREGAENKDPQEVEGRIIKEIKRNVMESVNNAKEIGADIYRFEDYLYRYKHKLWKEKKHEMMFNNFNEEDINVKVTYVKSINKIYGK